MSTSSGGDFTAVFSKGRALRRLLLSNRTEMQTGDAGAAPWTPAATRFQDLILRNTTSVGRGLVARVFGLSVKPRRFPTTSTCSADRVPEYEVSNERQFPLSEP